MPPARGPPAQIRIVTNAVPEATEYHRSTLFAADRAAYWEHLRGLGRVVRVALMSTDGTDYRITPGLRNRCRTARPALSHPRALATSLGPIPPNALG
jgi:hypothetical protein